MKTRLIAILFLLIGVQSAFADGTRGGGNMAVAEFYQTGNVLLKTLLSDSVLATQNKALHVELLLSNLNKTTVSSSPTPLALDGKAVDAINYPDKFQIVFYQSRWEQMSSEAKAHLIIHELLGISRISDLNYTTSQQILSVALGQSSLDNSRFDDSGMDCQEKRSIRGGKAWKLVQGLANAGIAVAGLGTDLEKLDLGPIFCSQGNGSSQGRELGIATCEAAQGIDLTAAQGHSLIDAFAFIGIHNEPGMGQDTYKVTSVACTIQFQNSAVPSYQCDVDGDWGWGCSSQP